MKVGLKFDKKAELIEEEPRGRNWFADSFWRKQESGDKELIFVFLLFLKEVKNQKTGN